MLRNLKIIMKKLLLMITFLPLIADSQTIKLNFVPNSGVVELLYNDLSIYTDSNSIFSVFQENKSSKGQKLKNDEFSRMLRNEFILNSSDSALISMDKLGINTVFKSSKEVENYILWIVLELVEKKRLKIYNSRKTLVPTLYSRKIGSPEEGLVRLVYFDKITDEELFSRLIYREN